MQRECKEDLINRTEKQYKHPPIDIIFTLIYRPKKCPPDTPNLVHVTPSPKMLLIVAIY